MTIENIKKRLAEAVHPRVIAVNKLRDVVKLAVILQNDCILVGYFPLTAEIDFKSVASQCTENEAKVASKEIYLIDGSPIIPDDAFLCSCITTLIIPGSIEKIGGGAFKNCKNLRQVIICEGVKSVGDSTFKGCECLESVILPQSLSIIYDEVFSGCNSLKNINMPKGLTKIGNYAFKGCTSLKEMVISYGETIRGVSEIEGCTALKSLKITSGVTGIGESAFEHCRALESITIPEGVSEIGDFAFRGCYALKEISIPESVTKIGDGSFMSCCNIRAISFLEGLTKIGIDAFLGCSRLKKIIIPNSVKKIGFESFVNCSSLETIVLPMGLKLIDSSTFEGCVSLKNITLPAALSTINCSAFKNCSALESVTLPETLKSIGNAAFENCTALKSVKIPESVSIIGNDAFNGCSSLESVNIPSNIKLGCRAFFNTAIAAPIIRNGILIYVPRTTKGKFIVEDGVSEIENCVFSGSQISEVYIPESVTEIGENAFNSCKDLRLVDINGKIEVIRYNTFAFCDTLHTVNLPQSLINIERFAFQNSGLLNIKIPEKVCYYGAKAFGGCKSLQEVTITNSETSLLASNFDNEAFADCTAITTVNLPKGITWGNIKVKFKDSPWSTMRSSKREESTLKNAKVRPMENTSFEFMAKAALAPGSVDIVMEKGFLNVKAKMEGNCYIIAVFPLKDAEGKKIPLLQFNWEPLKNIVANHKKDTTYLLYPENTRLTPAKVRMVMSFTGKTPNVVLLPGIKEICKYAFMEYRGLRSIEIPDTVKSIGLSAFRYRNLETPVILNSELINGPCVSNISSYTIPEGVTRIQKYAFEGCDNLEEVIIPSSVSMIYGYAFKDCRSLRRIVFKNPFKALTVESDTVPEYGYTIFDKTAFMNCKAIETVEAPNITSFTGPLLACLNYLRLL